MSAPDRLTISDGTEVRLRAPGVAFSVEAENGIPDLGKFLDLCGAAAKADSADEGERARARAAGEELEAKRRADVFRYGTLLIEHGTVEPRFREAPREGERAIGELIEPDYHALVGAISNLRGEALARSAAHYRPSVADPESSGRPDNAATLSDSGRAPC